MFSSLGNNNSIFAEELLLQDISNYRFISHGMQTVMGANDTDVFQETLRAMEIMNITHEEVKCKQMPINPAMPTVSLSSLYD